MTPAWRAATLWLAWACLCASAPARAAIDLECAAIESAFQRNAAAELAALTPASARALAHQQFRLASIHIQENARAEAVRAIRRGLKAVRGGLRAAPDDVELLLLGAMLDGERVLVARWSIFTSGLRGLRRLNRAERLQPDNPRAALIRGTAKVVLPALIGGDRREAIAILSPAVHEAATCDDGDWGQPDILMWLGRAHDAVGETERAADFYRRALERAPDSHWVRKALAGKGYDWVNSD